MKNEQILNKAIKKAVKNGYANELDCLNEQGKVREILSDYISYESHDIEALIFSHDFAKAFWGEENIVIIKDTLDCEKNNFGYDSIIVKKGVPAWKFHLQQMVLKKEPLKYLEKFL